MTITRRSGGGVGLRGYSAYEVAVLDGFVGTEDDWLASLVGPEGPEGPQGPEGPAGSGGGGGSYSGILAIRLVTADTAVVNSDAGGMVAVDSASAHTVTIPTGLTSNMELSVARLGTGSVSLVGATGVTWVPDDTRDTLAVQGGIAWLVHLGSNRWLRSGGLV